MDDRLRLVVYTCLPFSVNTGCEKKSGQVISLPGFPACARFPDKGAVVFFFSFRLRRCAAGNMDCGGKKASLGIFLLILLVRRGLKHLPTESIQESHNIFFVFVVADHAKE